MSYETLLYIIISGILALGLALFQYISKEKSMSKLDMLFSFLRFLSVFSVLLLIINPNFSQTELSIEKPNLVVAIDNSKSIKHLKQDTYVRKLIDKIKGNKKIQKKFTVNYYTFGENLKVLDSMSFLEQQTNISKAFTQLDQIYKQENSPILLLTDGNQTYGSDYQFSLKNYKKPIYPIILGDTIAYVDLKIQHFNVNKYAFLKNKFPVETILTYSGSSPITSKFIVKKGSTILYTKQIRFSKVNNFKVLNFTLPANKVGVNTYSATLTSLKKEKNKVNNTRKFAVEVIDQKTKIALVSQLSHPDLSALKKSIESNKQRSVTLLTPKDAVLQVNDFQSFIIYQPNNTFKDVFDLLNKKGKNKFVVVGTKTDLNFLNEVSKNYTHTITNQTESYLPKLNKDYLPFIVNTINFESFPPLLSNYSNVTFNIPFETILNKSVNDVLINTPLLSTFEINGQKEAVLFGENIWQWRAQSYINKKSFNDFDDFIGKLVQYITSNKQKSRLNLEYASFYNGSENIVVAAQFFDKNYVFDKRESLNITVTNKRSNTKKTLPLILKNNIYEVDLSGLLAGEYRFTVNAKNGNISKSGAFQVLEYDVEQQFLNANTTKLEQLATNSKGKSYFINKTEHLINDLINDKRYVSIQKSSKNNLPLVDWKYLLGIIVFCLTIEWFLRKYNGLI